MVIKYISTSLRRNNKEATSNCTNKTKNKKDTEGQKLNKILNRNWSFRYEVHHFDYSIPPHSHLFWHSQSSRALFLQDSPLWNSILSCLIIIGWKKLLKCYVIREEKKKWQLWWSCMIGIQLIKILTFY